MIKLLEAQFQFQQSRILNGVSQQFERGSVYHLIGKNGAGKTTFLEILAGLRQLESGSIVKDETLKTIFLGHRSGLSANLSPFENVSYLASFISAEKNIQSKQVYSALSYFALTSLASVPCYRLSAGQRRKVLLATLLVVDAELILLDEPYTSLDKTSCELLNEIINAKRKNGCTVIMSSHTKPAIADLESFTLENGKLSGNLEVQAV